MIHMMNINIDDINFFNDYDIKSFNKKKYNFDKIFSLSLQKTIIQIHKFTIY